LPLGQRGTNDYAFAGFTVSVDACGERIEPAQMMTWREIAILAAIAALLAAAITVGIRFGMEKATF
jgi:hypothetical protein